MRPLVATEDGSLSMLDEETGELYHNRAGAYTEALYNYFEPSDALKTLQKNGRLTLLDSCFGLGYNSFVLAEQLLRHNIKGVLKVIGIELDSTIPDYLAQIVQHENFSLLASGFDRTKPINFGRQEFICKGLRIEIELHNYDVRKLVPQLQEDFDLIFHDPFSPRRVPELWTLDIFKEYYRLLAARSGKVLTYSAAAAVRGGLQEAGFSIFRTQPVGAKSGGTLGSVGDLANHNQYVFPLTEQQLDILRTRSALPYQDFGFQLTRQEILEKRSTRH